MKLFLLVIVSQNATVNYEKSIQGYWIKKKLVLCLFGVGKWTSFKSSKFQRIFCKFNIKINIFFY